MTIRQMEKHWTKEAGDALTGKRVKAVRYLTSSEARDLDWYKRPLVIEFEDGTLLFPASDAEGNNGGVLFGQKPGGGDLTFPAL